jgi:hypothetical protein
MKRLAYVMLPLLLVGLLSTPVAAQSGMKAHDSFVLKGGKWMMTMGGKTMPLDKDVTLANGDMVMRDGTMMMKDGSTMKMQEGQRVMMDGHMAPAGKGATPAGKGKGKMPMKKGNMGKMKM